MKVNNHLRRIIYSSWFLASVPAIILILLLPPLGSKYKLIIEETGKVYSTDIYCDLNNDGITEAVRSGKGYPYYHVLVMDNNLRIYDQWNFKDDLDPGLSGVYFGNYDNDSFKEIYVFTCKGDSIFLNINEFFDPQGLKLERFFIAKMNLVNNVVTSSAFPAGFYDVTGDGIKEFYFSIISGFGLEPRKLYYLDIVKRDLKSSMFLGVNCQFPILEDADGDRKPEIFGLMTASGNYKVKTPFTDMSSWLMVFDETLNFEFPPVEFPGLTNALDIKAYFKGNFRGYLVSHTTGSADSSVLKPRIMMFSLSGEKVKEHLYSDYGLGTFAHLVVLNNKGSDRIFVLGTDLIELNNDLEIINRVKAAFGSVYYEYVEDINSDGENEFILYSLAEEKIAVYNSSLQMLAENNIKASPSLFKISHYDSKDKKHKLYLTSGDNACFLQLIKNNSYYLGYFAYPGIYLLIVLFISAINRINTIQVKQKANLNHRLLTLQLQGIKAQLDPHFTFNSLNSIASLIYLEERQAAYDYLNKFTKLLRGMLNDAEHVYRLLSEELEFVTTYLELEKMRFGDKLNYEVITGNDVTGNEKVPKLVLHTFAENAIKHGLMPNENGGKLKISVSRESDYLRIVVEDNGIGRQKSAGNKLSTGKGLKITGEFYDILNQLNKNPISHSIIDLYDASGQPAGTRVEVMVPVDGNL